jgi:6-phosphogluconate dehydrogenase
MDIGMVGLGRMGGNMARRLMQRGHRVVAHDRATAAVDALTGDGAQAARSLAELVAKLPAPRAVWLMLPAGEITEQAVSELSLLLARGDLVVDGGNSYFKDDVRRAALLAPKGVDYLDCGTSGGVWGLERGYCLMVGGTPQAFARLEPALAALAPGQAGVEPSRGRAGREGTAHLGYLHCGPVGSGHFAKMIHNGIEYGLMQAYAEGFDILKNAASEALAPELRYAMPLADLAELWRRGSVVGSWLLDLTAIALAEDEALARFSGHVQDSGEGRWTVQAAIEEAVPADVLSAALYARFRSRQQHTYAEKLLSAMRYQFGGHTEGGAHG